MNAVLTIWRRKNVKNHNVECATDVAEYIHIHGGANQAVSHRVKQLSSLTNDNTQPWKSGF